MDPRIHIVTLGVADLARATAFYRALGFETSGDSDDKISFFKTSGATLALYPREKLAEDIGPGVPTAAPGFSGTTLAHVARTREQVDAILAAAEAASGTIVKPAQEVFWGGYSGYFADPDGYFWEVAHWDGWSFNDDGSLAL